MQGCWRLAAFPNVYAGSHGEINYRVQCQAEGPQEGPDNNVPAAARELEQLLNQPSAWADRADTCGAGRRGPERSGGMRPRGGGEGRYSCVFRGRNTIPYALITWPFVLIRSGSSGVIVCLFWDGFSFPPSPSICVYNRRQSHLSSPFLDLVYLGVTV